jgi:hypothetical protein
MEHHRYERPAMSVATRTSAARHDAKARLGRVRAISLNMTSPSDVRARIPDARRACHGATRGVRGGSVCPRRDVGYVSLPAGELGRLTLDRIVDHYEAS